MKKNIVLLSLLILGINNVKAQAYKQFKTIDELTPPSPNSSNLGQYGNLNVNGNSGAINLDVPLQTLNFYGLQIPINISYYSQGLKPNEEASRFGLGWTSSFEPVITRQIKGIDDLNITIYERNQIGYVYTDEKIPEYGISLGTGQVPPTGNPYIDKFMFYNHQYLNSATVGWDSEQDDFTLNIFGETVSFVLSQKKLTNNKIIAQYISNDKNYRINYIEGDQTFEVTNDRGYTFLFTEKEYSITAPDLGYGMYGVTESTRNKIITTWKLNRIIAPNKKEVKYTYNRKHTQSPPIFSNTKVSNLCGTPNDTTEITKNKEFNSSSIINGFEILELSNIKSDFFNIELMSSNRNDIIYLGEPSYPSSTISQFLNGGIKDIYPKKIDDIKITDFQNNTINNYKFYTSYFNSDKINESKSKYFLRLKLDKIERNNEFYYQFNYSDINSLPEKRNNAIDFWGFYNGNSSNYLFYPTYNQDPMICHVYPGGGNTELGLRISEKGDNRFPNFSFSKIGSLENVIYPTKGYSKFLIEPNDIRIDKLNEDNLNIINYGFDIHTKFSTESNSVDYPIYSQIIEVNKEIIKPIEFEINLGCAGNYNYSPQNHQKCDIEYKDKDILAYKLIDLSNNNIIFQGTYYDKVVPNNNTIFTEKVNLPVGRYQLFTQGFKHISNFFDEQEGIYQDQNHPDYGKQYNYGVKVITKLPKLLISDSYSLEVGGFRVKEISDYDHNKSILNKKLFQYSYMDNSSSGVLSDPIIFHNMSMYQTSRDDYGSGGPGLSFNFAAIELSSSTILDSPSKSFMGYKRIIEKNISNNIENGKKNSYYNHDTNIYGTKANHGNQMIFLRGTESPQYMSNTIAKYPFTSFEFSNGKLIKEEFYTNFKKIKERKYYYDDPYNVPNFAQSKVVSSNIKMDMKTEYYFGHSGGGIYKTSMDFDILQIYRRVENNPMLIKTIDTDFFVNSNDSIVSTTDNVYNRFQLTKQSTQNSKGETITTEYQYPPDLVTGYTDSNKMSQLVLQNRISEPVITKQKVGNTYISEIHNQYAEFNGILQKSILHQKKGSGIDINKTDDRKVIYSSYDNKGNLTQYALQNGISVAIIWGYNGQYPIAKIEGAAYSEVSAYISDLETKSNNGSLTKDSFNTLRTALPHAMITTYVYQPLVGVTSITTPNGQTEYYKYDAANRLEEVRNDKKEVIKTLKYNYKQP